MSDMLTHWGVFDDCRRLAAGDPAIDPDFQHLMESERQYARLGAITRDGNRFMPSLLTVLRKRWETGRPETDTRRKLAFVLGCLTHQACDNAMKPLISQVAGADWSRAHLDIWSDAPGASERYKIHNEISAYYDTHVFRKVYLSGHEEPFTTNFLADTTGGAERLEEFVRSLFQRALLASHTLKPDLSAPEEWLDHVFAFHQQLYVDVKTYVRVYTAPEPARLEKYRVSTEFYLDDDPVIRVARALQSDSEVPTDLQGQRYALGPNHSSYGRALALGIEYLRNGSAYWHGLTDELQTPNWV